MEAAQAERKIQMDDNLQKPKKNDFRDEVAKQKLAEAENQKTTAERVVQETEKVGEAEMVRRDNFVMMRQLQVERDVIATTTAANEASIEAYAQLAEEVAKLPFSEAAVGVLAMLEKRVGQLVNIVKGGGFGRLNELTLLAFERATQDEATVPLPEQEEPEQPREDPDKEGDNEDDMKAYDEKNELTVEDTTDTNTAEELKE